MRILKKSRGFIPFLLVLLILFPSLGSSEAGVRVAVLPFKVYSEKELGYLKRAVMDMLTSRIGSAGNITIVRSDLAANAVKKYPDLEFTEKEVLEDIGKELGADYVLFGSFTVFEEEVSLDAKLVNMKDASVKPFYAEGKGLGALVKMAEDISAKVISSAGGIAAAEKVLEKGGKVLDAPSYTGKFAAKEKERPAAEKEGLEEEGIVIKKKKEEGGFRGKKKLGDDLFEGMEMADLDGDGKKELFLLSEKEIVIARIKGDDIEKISVIKGGGDVRNVSLSSYDGNNDGRPEIYVSRLKGSSPDGCILEPGNGGFVYSLCGIPFFMKAVNVPGTGMALLGQEFRTEWGFNKRVSFLKRESGMIQDAGDFDIPAGVNLYDFEVFDITGDGRDDVVSLDDRNRVRIYEKTGDGWEEKWRSPETYGGTLNIIDIEKEKGGKNFVMINAGLLYFDLDHDGKNELIIKKNIPGGIFGGMSERVRAFKSGSIMGLDWDGAAFSEKWKTKDLGGYIADFLIEGAGGEDKEIFILVDESGLFSGKGGSYLLSYKIIIE